MAEKILKKFSASCSSENCNLYEQRSADIKFALGRLKEIASRGNYPKRSAPSDLSSAKPAATGSTRM